MNASTQITLFAHVTFLDKLLFTKHLGMMIRSGIPIGEAVEAIRDQSQNPAMQKVLTAILDDVNNGQTLENALAKHSKIFDPFYLNMIRIGETSGNLEKNLEYVAEQLKKNNEFNKKVQGALLYPEIVLTIAVLAGGGVSIFVLPKLLDLFKSFNAKLPVSTQILLFIAGVMKSYGYFIFGGIIGLFFLIRFLITFPRIRVHWDTFLLSIPVLGVFFRNVQLGFFCRNLGIMLTSGLPITTALAAQRQATTNLVFQQYVEDMKDGVEKGKSLTDCFEKKQKTFIPQILIKMIEVGEKTGKLEESFSYLADFFEDEVDDYSRNFSTILEPIVLILIGLIVAFVALSIISPIYDLTASIHG